MTCIASTPSAAPANQATHSDAPFFIVGAHRSGTSMLKLMLCGSGRIFIGPETDFLPRFFPTSQTQLDQTDIQRIAYQLASENRYRHVRHWLKEILEDPTNAQSIENLLADNATLPLDPSSFMDQFIGAIARKRNASRWGDTTPAYANHVAHLAELFPTAKFIHIVRDGRDAAYSMVEKWGSNEWHTDLCFALHTWNRRVSAAHAQGQNLPETRYQLVRYENLVANPEPVIRELCDFLDEPFDPAMLSPSSSAEGRPIEANSTFHSRLHQSPNTQHVARWKQTLSPFEQAIAQRLIGKTLQQLDYDPTPDSLNAKLHWMKYWGYQTKYAMTHTADRLVRKLGLRPPN